MKILGIDFETTGLDAQKDRITEAGVVLYDTDSKQPVRITGFLVKGGIVSPEIERLTGITQAAIDEFGVEPVAAIKAIAGIAQFADFYCAHNAEFDRGFLQAEVLRQLPTLPKTLDMPWIDTRTDLPVAAYQLGKSASLKYLACDHGFIYSAHRAVNDVLAMFEILSQYDINETIRRAQTPNVKVRAVVSFDERLQAKEMGFFWNPDRKIWWRPIKQDEVDDLKVKCQFPVVQMEGA